MNVVCFGDSNTYGYDPCDKFGEHYSRRWTDILAELTGWNVINEGVNGREVPDEPICLEPDTDLFIVMLGTNDLLQLDSPEAIADRMEAFLSGALPEKLVLVAPPAMVWGDWVQEQDLIDDSLQVARLYEALAKRIGVRYIDTTGWNIPIASDGVHFTLEGQRVFADFLAKELFK